MPAEGKEVIMPAMWGVMSLVMLAAVFASENVGPVASSSPEGGLFVVVSVEEGARPFIRRETIAGATVTVRCPEVARKWVVVTDHAGRARFPGLPVGSCEAEAEMPGYDHAIAQIKIRPGENHLALLMSEWRFVSLVNLLATPERYDGLPVAVSGYLSIGVHHVALFLHEHDARYFLSRNGVRIAEDGLNRSELPRNRYVMVRGVFEAARTSDFFSGILRSVVEVYEKDGRVTQEAP